MFGKDKYARHQIQRIKDAIEYGEFDHYNYKWPDQIKDKLAETNKLLAALIDHLGLEVERQEACLKVVKKGKK